MLKVIFNIKSLLQHSEVLSHYGRAVKLKNSGNNFFNVKRFSSINIQEQEELTPNIQEICQGDPALEHKLKVIVLEADVLRQEGKNVPSNSFIKKHHWEELLKLETRTARRKYFSYLFKTEKTKENKKGKKERKQLERLEQRENDEVPTDGALKYTLGHNNILMRVYDTTINQMYNNKLIQAMQFSQKIVMDLGYNEHMTTRENINCAKQLMLVFAENRAHDEPFDLHFCNADKESNLIKSLYRHIPTMYEPWFPFNIHEKSYLDLFPKENLVYLTPHCREELIKYSHDDVYIIGGIVDKVNNEPVSLAKAKREGLRMAKFPLDHYLQWGAGSSKSLTLNQVLAILLDIRRTGDWKYALRHVPRRKIVEIGNTISNINSLRYDKDYYSRKKQAAYLSKASWKPSSNKYGEERLVKVKSIFKE